MKKKTRTKTQLLAEIQASEKIFRDLAEQSPCMIFINVKGKIAYVNKKCEEYMGYTKEEFYAPEFNWHDLIAPENREIMMSNFRKHMNGEEVPPVEYSLITKDGGKIEAILSTNLINYEGERAILGTVTDITARKQAEEALRDSEERFRNLMEYIPEPIQGYTTNGTIFYWNKASEKFYGYTEKEATGKNLGDLIVPPDLKPYFTECLGIAKNIKQSGEFMPPVELLLRHKEGHLVPVYSIHTAVYIGGKEPLLFCINIDLTERKRLEEELLKSEKLESIGILAGGIAHDFNNILTAILGYISLAKMDSEAEGNLSKVLDDAERATFLAKDLTQQLLTFAKGGAPVKTISSIKELIKDSITFSLRGSKVKSALSLADDLWPVEADEGQISQVINNFIINAQHAMPEGGTIKITAENVLVDTKNTLPLQEGKYIKINISDQGPGIPRELLTKIFDPYFTTKHKGSGLGLAVAYSIIKNHGGYISVESEQEVGTHFTVYLPASPKKIHARKDSVEKALSGKGRILVMDDNKLVRDVLGDILRYLGYLVDFSKDGAEAIRIYRKALASGQPFDAVIMDLTVPGGKGGKETVQELLQIDPGVKAIVSSGYSTDPVMANYKEYGFIDVITKPYKTTELSKKIHKIVHANE